MTKREANIGATSRNTVASTVTILCGLALTGAALPSDRAAQVFTVASLGLGVSLGLATFIEARGGVRGLVRVDILILWVLYGLTFLEFLFPQPDINDLVSPDAAASGTLAVFLGFAGLVIGRHLFSKYYRYNKAAAFNDLRPTIFFLMFVLATLVGYLPILLAVDFDVLEMLQQMTLPRFSQSWSRGQFGGAYSLLYELQLLIYLIPAIAGLIYARSKSYTLFQKLFVTIVLAITIYYGFAGGTRNVIATYVISCAGIYFLAKPGIGLGRVLLVGAPIGALLMIAMAYMLEFRTVGLGKVSLAERHYDTLFIDHNMVSLSKLIEVFPSSFDYLGFEIPINAIIRPIPRFLWPSKPEGLSITIESALGVTSPGMTISCTYIGEAYMAGGLFAVLFFSLCFGSAAEMWNRVGSDINSQFSQLLYVSGFFAAAIGMRSMLFMVPFMLPTIALWLFGRLWLSRPSLKRKPHRSIIIPREQY